jgi:hypothetical protein
VAVATFHAKAIFQLDGFATKSAPSLCGGRVAFEGAQVNPAVEATPLERAAIAPREGKLISLCIRGGRGKSSRFPLSLIYSNHLLATCQFRIQRWSSSPECSSRGVSRPHLPRILIIFTSWWSRYGERTPPTRPPECLHTKLSGS